MMLDDAGSSSDCGSSSPEGSPRSSGIHARLHHHLHRQNKRGDISASNRSPRTYLVSSARYDDIRQLVDIEFFAFENEKTNHVLSYRDYNQPAHLERAVRSYQALMTSSPSEQVYRWRGSKASSVSAAATTTTANGTVVRFHKVTDEDAGVIISWAKTETKAYTEAELASPADCGHETDPAMNRDWFALNERLRRDYMGTTRHCCKFFPIPFCAPHPGNLFVMYRSRWR